MSSEECEVSAFTKTEVHRPNIRLAVRYTMPNFPEINNSVRERGMDVTGGRSNDRVPYER